MTGQVFDVLIVGAGAALDARAGAPEIVPQT
jgi:hypothetical protein